MVNEKYTPFKEGKKSIERIYGKISRNKRTEIKKVLKNNPEKKVLINDEKGIREKTLFKQIEVNESEKLKKTPT